jgi:hypothetical protein
MTLDLDIKALSTITAALRQLENVWMRAKEDTEDEDEIADLTNDLLYAQSLREDLERQMSEQP